MQIMARTKGHFKRFHEKFIHSCLFFCGTKVMALFEWAAVQSPFFAQVFSA